MKNLKKAISLIIALASVSSFLPSALASGGGGGAAGGSADPYEIPGQEVLYYTDFETGTNADLPQVEHEKYFFYGRNADLRNALNEGMEYIHNSDTAVNTHTYRMALDDLIASEFDGDIGCRVRTNCSIGSGPVVMLDFRYKDADKTPTEEGALKSGIYKFEFDFVLDGAVSKSDGFRVEANCKHGNCGNSFAWMMNNTWHNLSGGNTWSYTEKDIPITNDELHHYEIIFDLDNNIVHTYMDGVKYKNTTFKGNINFLHLTIGGKMKFIDDIKFSQLQSDLKANVEWVDSQTMEFSVPDYLESAENVNIEFTDVYTGDKVNATVSESWKTGFTATLEEPLVVGHEYTAAYTSGSVKGIRGNIAIDDFNLGTENSVKKITFKDAYGNETGYVNDPVAELESLKFCFTEDVNAKEALGNLTIEDSEGNPVDITVEETGESNVAIANVLLSGPESYEMKLSGMNIDYVWNFTTKEGKFEMLPLELYREDGVTPVQISNLAQGDKIKVKLTVFNSLKLEEDLPVLLTAGVYSGNSLDDFEFETVVVNSSSHVYEKTIELEIKDMADVKVKGFIWKGLGSRVPLAPSVSAE